jgi:hypothetical protein
VNDVAFPLIERAIAQGTDADDILRRVVAALVEAGGCRWAGIFFVENGALVLGPEAGAPDPAARQRTTVAYDGDQVAELAADGGADTAFLERVASTIAPFCLVGWDTGGLPWDETA